MGYKKGKNKLSGLELFLSGGALFSMHFGASSMVWPMNWGKDQQEAKKWLDTTGKENITTLNEVLKETANSVFDKI